MAKSGGAREDRTPDLSSAIAGKGAVRGKFPLITEPFEPVSTPNVPVVRSASDPRPTLDNYVPSCLKDLYFIACDGQIKIGISQNPERRLATMRTGNTRPMELLAALPAMGWQEKVWHLAFCNLRRAGEWFSDTPELREAIRAAANGEEWIPTLRHPSHDDEESHYRWRNRVADAEEWAEAKALAKVSGQSKVPSTPTRCTPGNHRCLALMLAFFDLLNDGEIGPMTRAAVAQCEGAA